MKDITREKVYKDVRLFEKNLHSTYGKDIKIYVAIRGSNPSNMLDLDLIFNSVVEVVAEHSPHLIDYFLTEKKTRVQEYCNYMHAFAYISRKNGHTFHSIGRWVRKDHATIIHGNKKAQNLLETKDKDFERVYNLILNQIDCNVGISEQDPQLQDNT
jgi:hypothetical protein